MQCRIVSAIRSAVELLLAGVPIERLSVLLGHQSVRVTEKHYNPWVHSRQEQLEADVRNASKSDTLIIGGTKEVQIRTVRPNEKWRRGWDSDSLHMKKRRNLLILRSARTQESATKAELTCKRGTKIHRFCPENWHSPR